MAGYDPNRFIHLVEKGFFVPVARNFWFDSRERDKLFAKHIENPDKSNTYRWSPLDDVILSSRNYIKLDNQHREYAEQMEKDVPAERPKEFANLVAKAIKLRHMNKLGNYI